MRNDKARAIAHEMIHCFLDQQFCARIHVRGGFIQDEERPVSKHGTSYGQQLLLPRGNSRAVLGYNRIIALRQAADEMVAVCIVASTLYILAAGIWTAISDILCDSALK